MPDIAMCTNKYCPIRLTCFRFMARPSEHSQDYMHFNHAGCENYMPMNGVSNAKAKA